MSAVLELAERRQIFDAIYQQMGGARFVMMTGAKNLTILREGGLMFTLPRGAKNRAKWVKVILDPNDTYNMVFYDAQSRPVGEIDGLYADMLQDVFTSETGLYTRF